jgi:outer membrane protein TolC
MMFALALMSLLSQVQVFPAAQAFASDSNAITFDEALRLALAYDSGVASSRRALELANLRLVAAEASRYPTLTLKASPLEVSWTDPKQLPITIPDATGSKRTASGIGLGAVLPVGEGKVSFSMEGLYSKTDSKDPVWNDGWQISISLPIIGKSSVSTGSYGLGGVTGGGSYEDQVRSAKAAVRNAEFELDRAIAKARSGLETAYHSLLRDAGRLEAARMNLERMERHFAMVEARHAQGNASDLDLIDAEQGVKSAEIAVDAAGHALKISEMSLNRLIGRDLNASIVPEPVGEYIKEPLLPLDEYVNLALAQRQEPVLIEENLANAKIELDTARSGLLPQVSVRGSLTDDGSWSIGVDLLKILPRDYASEFAVKSAENAVDASKQNLVAAREAIVLEVTGTYYALLEAEAHLSLAESAIEKAIAVLGIRETQYTVGAATHQDVTAAIEALHEAETDLANAHAGCFAARSRLTDAVGAK